MRDGWLIGAPDPRENSWLIGHEAAEAVLSDAIRTNRMHHAWLMTGPSGIGKATLAFRFARQLFARTGSGLVMDAAHPVFRRVAAGTHADLLTIERGYDEKRKCHRSEIVVDDVRTLADFMRLTPAEGGWRVVIVDGAEYLNRNAANALLKVLEEPPQRALLMLVCAAPGRLLPTIRSRCRHLRLSALNEADMQHALTRYLPDTSDDECGRLAKLAEGSPGRALSLAAGDGLAIAGMVDEVLASLPRPSMLKAYDMADTLVKTDGGFTTYMDLLRAAIAAEIRQEISDRRTGEGRLSRLRPLPAWGEVWQALSKLQNETQWFNLDKRQAVVSSVALLSATNG